MTFDIFNITDPLEKQKVSREILYSLPDWFGIPESTENYIKETAKEKVTFLTVKTLAATRECPEYARTRAFYKGTGFTELEILTELWGEDNPCAYMVKKL